MNNIECRIKVPQWGGAMLSSMIYEEMILRANLWEFKEVFFADGWCFSILAVDWESEVVSIGHFCDDQI